MVTLAEKIERVLQAEVAIVDYDPGWPRLYADEQRHLLSCLPPTLIRRIEHFGSTAVPGLAAKPIVDMLIEVTSLEETRQRIAPILEEQGYDYFWRPTCGNDTPPWYAWFIKYDGAGHRSHHLHMVEGDYQEHWDRLLFRDFLREHPDCAREYAALKRTLATAHHGNRAAYAEAKSAFIGQWTRRAKEGPGMHGRR